MIWPAEATPLLFHICASNWRSVYGCACRTKQCSALCGCGPTSPTEHSSHVIIFSFSSMGDVLREKTSAAGRFFESKPTHGRRQSGNKDHQAVMKRLRPEPLMALAVDFSIGNFRLLPLKCAVIRASLCFVRHRHSVRAHRKPIPSFSPPRCECC